MVVKDDANGGAQITYDNGIFTGNSLFGYAIMQMR
jgi:hypothetical protein